MVDNGLNIENDTPYAANLEWKTKDLVKNRVWIKVGGVKIGTGLIIEEGFFKKKIVSLDLFDEYLELLK